MSNRGRNLRLLSNLPLPNRWEWKGESWETLRSNDFTLAEIRSADLLVVNGSVNALTKIALFGLVIPDSKKPTVAVDLVLRKPRNSVKAFMLRAVLNRVDHFIHYFRDIEGYQRFWGIGPERSEYVPFKPNIRYRYTPKNTLGEYVLCFGESMRDFANYLMAMTELEIPGAITEWAVTLLKREGITIPIPKNVQVLQDNRTQEAMINILEGAKIVAIPMKPENINASGISIYLNAMLLGKPVVLTEGPGVSDLLTEGQALIVPPGDHHALGNAVKLLWNDPELSAKYAETGRRYAESLGGEPELHDRIRDAAMNWYYKDRVA